MKYFNKTIQVRTIFFQPMLQTKSISTVGDNNCLLQVHSTFEQTGHNKYTSLEKNGAAPQNIAAMQLNNALRECHK